MGKWSGKSAEGYSAEVVEELCVVGPESVEAESAFGFVEMAELD